MQRLFRQFSSPGGIPSHVSVTTPGSIHEGGELGYVLVHAFGAVMDNPDLIALAVVGDGEAETGPLEGSWKGISFLNPTRDGAVLPVLHLNGAKIAGPTVLARKDPAEVRSLLRARLRGAGGGGRGPARHAPPPGGRDGAGVHVDQAHPVRRP
jgi:xylulose-5-phosphate/fructose-6-phosphate phosphoketolase